MRIYDLIAKKRDGGTHTREELEAIVNGFVSGEVADYQMAAWMMAVYLRGMTDAETAELTDVMAHSGVMVDLSPRPRPHRRHHRQDGERARNPDRPFTGGFLRTGEQDRPVGHRPERGHRRGG